MKTSKITSLEYCVYTEHTDLHSMTWIFYFLKSDTFVMLLKYSSTQGDETMGGYS